MAERIELRVEDLQSVFRRYLELLRRYREALNRLNVYPVPDGDTGTNMTMTVEAVVGAAERTREMSEFARAIADGSLMGAQGNSGIILSQVLRAMAGTLAGERSLTGPLFAEALDRASVAAYRAVGKPVEGTILTVLRSAAEAADRAGGDGDAVLARMIADVYEAADESLRRTPELLPVLAEAGVVDAGGAGLLLMLAAVLEQATGEAARLPEDVFTVAGDVAATGGSGEARSVAGLRYEVMFLIDGDDDAPGRLKEAWADVGDSVVVVGGDGTWNCHIHTDEIGAAIEAGIGAGRPYRIVVTDLLEQAAGARGPAEVPVFEPLAEVQKAKVGLIAVAAGDGVVELFRQSGAQGVVFGGQTMNPSVGDLLEVVEAVPARSVVVLPNNRNVVPAAEELDRLTRKTVHVVATTSIPQGIAAAVGYLPSKEADEFVPAMRAAASLVTTGELTRAVRDANTPVGSIREGDWLGVVDGTVSVIVPCGRRGRVWGAAERLLVGAQRTARRRADRAARAFRRALIGVLQRTVAEDAEVVTIVCGAGADEGITRAATDWLAEHRREVDVSVVPGGQPLYPYLVGAE